VRLTDIPLIDGAERVTSDGTRVFVITEASDLISIRADACFE